MSNTVKTEKGTVLPLTNLKGKDYLMVAYRIQWMNEQVERFDINTDLLLVNDEQTIARARVTIYNKEGTAVKSATATKRETKKDFSDHTEKAETSAIGRALAMLGYGTQFAIADLDEGQRLADSPLVNTKASTSLSTSGSSLRKSEAAVSVKSDSEQSSAPATEASVAKTSSFRKPAGSAPKAWT